MAEKKKCLIVVDFQNDFVSGLGSVFPGAEQLAPRIAEKIRQYRDEGEGSHIYI